MKFPAAVLVMPALPALLACASIATAQPESIRITLHVTAPASPKAAARLLARIDRAALEVCGADPSSLRELKLAIQRSRCWRTSVADAVAQVHDPLLTAAFDRRRPAAGADATQPAQ